MTRTSSAVTGDVPESGPAEAEAAERTNPGEVAEADVVVVGSGLAGLTAATYAARAGATVLRVEARRAAGGRARSDEVAGCTVDFGPHALYRTGATRRVVDELAIPWSGGRPRQRGLGWIVGGRRLPGLAPRAFGGPRGLQALARVLRPSTAERYRGRSVADVLADQPAAARPVIAALVRLATYTAHPEDLEATAGLAQLRRGARLVDYLDGGWQTLVDGFGDAARRAGAAERLGKVTGVARDGDRWRVALGDGSVVRAGAVVLAVGGAADASRLVGGASAALERWAAAATPVYAACLSVLCDGPSTRRVGAYALDRPVYTIDQARSARLGPPGHHVIHGLYYQPDRTPEVDPRAAIEAQLTAWYPGWRERVVDVVERRRVVVAHDQPRPTGERAGVVIPDLDGVFLAGDAVTDDGLLADAATSSGRRAGLAAAAAARPGRPASARAGVVG